MTAVLVLNVLVCSGAVVYDTSRWFV